MFRLPDCYRPSIQKWIRKTVSQQQALLVSDLVAGKADAFVTLHTTAMVSLVTDSVTIAIDTIPETLLFDLHRLSIAQLEFTRVVDNAVALVTANHSIIGSDKSPSEDKRRVISGLNELLVAGGSFDVTEFCSNLDSAGVLTDPAARGKFIKAVTLSTEDRNDPIRQLM